MLFRRRPVPGQVYVGTQGSWESAGWRSPVQMPGHAVLRLRNGEITTLTGRESTRPGDRYRRVDLRRVQMQVHPQTVPTAEGLDITAEGRHLECMAAAHHRDRPVRDAGRYRLQPGAKGKRGNALIDAFIFAGAGRPDCVWIGGSKVVAQGRHVGREAIEKRFRAAMKELAEG